MVHEQRIERMVDLRNLDGRVHLKHMDMFTWMLHGKIGLQKSRKKYIKEVAIDGTKNTVSAIFIKQNKKIAI